MGSKLRLLYPLALMLAGAVLAMALIASVAVRLEALAPSAAHERA